MEKITQTAGRDQLGGVPSGQGRVERGMKKTPEASDEDVPDLH